jgi:8-oxo-dGTP diphosphatase
MKNMPASGDRLKVKPLEIAIAIIAQDGKFLMQLRDDIPGIIYPGVWGLFGGHLEPGEDPETGLKRELIEEITYAVDTLSQFDCHVSSRVIRHTFYTPLLVAIDQLELREGWDLGLVTPEDIRRGCCYSEQAGEERLIADIHQKILLDFMDSHLYPTDGG